LYPYRLSGRVSTLGMEELSDMEGLVAVAMSELNELLRAIPGYTVLPGVNDQSVSLLFRTENFKNRINGEKLLAVIVALEENGEYIKVMSPGAFEVKGGRHVDAFWKACMMIQWRTKLIQFEYDESDGEVRPIVEWPIEDGGLTSMQLRRAIDGLVQLVDRYTPALELAASKGRIALD
jgi:hypothetical protein